MLFADPLPLDAFPVVLPVADPVRVDTAHLAAQLGRIVDAVVEQQLGAAMVRLEGAITARFVTAFRTVLEGVRVPVRQGEESSGGEGDDEEE